MSIKKIIFGVVGFLIAGTSTTLTVLLVKNKNEKKDLKSDQKVQINNLFKKSINGLLVDKNLFEAIPSGRTKSGEKTKIVQLKKNVTILDMIQIEAAINNNIFETFVSRGNTIAIKNQDLLNDNVVKIRFSIKSEFQATHTFPNDFTNIISFKVSDLKKEIDTSLLSKESFKVVKNTSGSGTFSIANKSGVSFPVEVKVLYAIKRPGQALGAYSDLNGIAPDNLNRGDAVWIKFAIKDNSFNKFPSAFTNTPFLISVPKRVISAADLSSLSQNLFEVFYSSGTHSEEKLKKLVITEPIVIGLPNKVEIEASINNGPFEKFVPEMRRLASKNQNLLDNTKIRIRFSIKSDFQATHTFPNDFTNIISFKVSDLKKEIDTSLLSKESFKVVKNTSGSGTFSIANKSGVSFPVEVKVLYAIKRPSQALGAYSDLNGIAPDNLNRGDAVWIKFAIKDNTFYKFPSTFANTPFLISVPKRVISASDLSSLSQNLFIASYSSGTHSEEKLKKLVIAKPIISLPSKVEIEASINDGPFEKFVPEMRGLASKNQNLLDNTKIRIRFSIKSKFQATHTFPNDFTNIISFKVSDLKKEIDTSLLSKESFKVVKNTSGSGTFSIANKSGVSFPVEVKVLYAIKRPSQALGSYSDLNGIAPDNLNRGDAVWIKFAIKDNTFYKFPSTFANTPFLISVPKRVISAADLSSLSQNLFIASYSSGTHSEEKLKKLVIAKPIISLPSKVEIEASINDGPFEKFVPEMRGLASKNQNLLDNTKIRIRFSIKSKFQATHTFPNDFIKIISFKVSDLKKEIDTSLLSKESFELVKNNDGSRTFSIANKSGVSFPVEVKVLYAIKRPSQALGSYSDLNGIAPDNLNRGDAVWIKFAIKDNTFYKFPSTFANTPFKLVA